MSDPLDTPSVTGRIVVVGGGGFLGSHICDRLLAEPANHVVSVDNYSTGSKANIEHLLPHPRFREIEHDICRPLVIDEPIDMVMNLASPASPKDYLDMPIETLEVGSLGTRNCIELALANEARLFMASTSEVYGDPQVHPQPESYWGNVNPVGVRSVYDEAKRFSEAMIMAYVRERGLQARVARIFNTYGPRMKPDDGRVVSNFVMQALRGDPITIYGDGQQTRSFCYVDDEVTGLLALAHSDLTGPVNIGNPQECTVLELAEMIIDLTSSSSPLVFEPLPSDDPTRRRPDIGRARAELDWQPQIDVREGLRRTVDHFRSQLAPG